jgi:predicted O-methyltransferase YrrM
MRRWLDIKTRDARALARGAERIRPPVDSAHGVDGGIRAHAMAHYIDMAYSFIKRALGSGAAWCALRCGTPLPHRCCLPFMLNHAGLAGAGAEIGVGSGMFSEIILAYSSITTLYSIDAWQAMPRNEYRDICNDTGVAHAARKRAAESRLARFGARSAIMQCRSPEAAGLFADASLDFVYIDANHAYEAVRADLAAWWPKVRAGGIFAGHDYLNGTLPQGVFGVRQAVNEHAARTGAAVRTTCERWPSWYCVKSS